MKYLTLQQIRKHYPCADQYKLAVKFFHGRAKIAVTDKAALSVAALFDWDWLAKDLLPDFERKAYDNAKATAWKAYNDAKAPARKAYLDATAPARKAYRYATALAFVRAYRRIK